MEELLKASLGSVPRNRNTSRNVSFPLAMWVLLAWSSLGAFDTEIE